MTWAQLNFQDPACLMMDLLMDFHNTTMLTMVMIIIYIIFILSTMTNTLPTVNLHSYHHHYLECVWTILPGMILLTLAVPSMRLLYLMEDPEYYPLITIKITGHQWYWSYDYSNWHYLKFDSFMVPTDDLYPGELRLLEVDNRLVVPMSIESRYIITSEDVLHSWTIPAMGVKADAVPGRLNQIWMNPTKTGIYYGQCSEICGANHSFMPIALEVMQKHTFPWWLFVLHLKTL